MVGLFGEVRIIVTLRDRCGWAVTIRLEINPPRLPYGALFSASRWCLCHYAALLPASLP